MRILAIDLGKSNSVACDYETGSGTHEFYGIKTIPGQVMDLLKTTQPDRVVIEISSQAGWVGDLVRSADVELQVANANEEAWRWKKVKRKTDRDDALKLAKLSAMNQLPLVYLPAYGTRQWRSLIGYRQTLVARRTAVKNRIRSILDREALSMPAGKSGWTQKRLKVLRTWAQPIETCDIHALWRGQLHEELEHLERMEASIRRVEQGLDNLASKDSRVRRLMKIPGVGKRLSEMVVAVLDDPHRFDRGKQVAAYVGMVPRQFQSGAMDRQGRITGHGHRDLRKLLVEVSWLGLRWNPRMREIYERVHRGSKSRKKIAIVAVARRLLIWCWAILRDDADWQAITRAGQPSMNAKVA